MRIAFFTDDYLPYVHGVVSSIQNYRQALENLGHEVYIIAPKKPGYLDNDDHIIRLASVNSFVFDSRPISLIYPGMARSLDSYNFDVVHSHTQFYMGILAGLVAKRQNIPHITTVHTLYTELMDEYRLATTAGLIAMTFAFPFVYKTRPVLPFQSRREIINLPIAGVSDVKKKQGWRLIAETVNQADASVSPSEHLAQKLRDSGARVPIRVLPNGIPLGSYELASVDDSPIRKDPNQKIIICVARVSGEKRPEVLIEAMRDMKTPNVRLVLVGDGPMLEELDTYVEQHGLQDKVSLVGMQKRQQVQGLLKQADVFALASYRFDNQPVSILEAIASGLPIVYCDDNLTEGLTDENSVLTDSPDAESFAAAFDDLLADETALKSMSSASMRVAEEFDSQKLATALVRYYQKVIDGYYEPGAE